MYSLLTYHIHIRRSNIRYVTWEIAPGRLLDGSIVDVWSKSDEVSWEMVSCLLYKGASSYEEQRADGQLADGSNISCRADVCK